MGWVVISVGEDCYQEQNPYTLFFIFIFIMLNLL
jgi:hypothetical protein